MLLALKPESLRVGAGGKWYPEAFEMAILARSNDVLMILDTLYELDKYGVYNFSPEERYSIPIVRCRYTIRAPPPHW